MENINRIKGALADAGRTNNGWLINLDVILLQLANGVPIRHNLMFTL